MRRLLAFSALVLTSCLFDQELKTSPLCAGSVLDEDPAELCGMFPWGPAEECPEEASSERCQVLLENLEAAGSCGEITTCDYIQCQAVMRQAPCGHVPAVCRPIYECLSMPAPGV